ncbi:uncharacterized protein LOC133535680 [Nerophis ophidion]|uniref:uncharacterized protein LOC133535680 n=1 Tax=Nerophis ophidion TaxID=159077 RepID=UPI002ADFFC18|nr:uncharacterized protein LOC133535680 [Nerophis ophidion]
MGSWTSVEDGRSRLQRKLSRPECKLMRIHAGAELSALPGVRQAHVNLQQSAQGTCLHKPAQPAIPGQNVATCPQRTSVSASRGVCLIFPCSLCFPGCLLNLDLLPGHGLLTPLSSPRPHGSPRFSFTTWTTASRSKLPGNTHSSEPAMEGGEIGRSAEGGGEHAVPAAHERQRRGRLKDTEERAVGERWKLKSDQTGRQAY